MYTYLCFSVHNDCVYDVRMYLSMSVHRGAGGGDAERPEAAGTPDLCRCLQDPGREGHGLQVSCHLHLGAEGA